MADNEIAVRSSRTSPNGNMTFEGTRILFRNFEGREGRYNAKGDRNFCLILADEDAEVMKAAGWNIKYLKAREEGEPDQPYVKVFVSYKYESKAPRVVLITSRGRTAVPEDLVQMLDWAPSTNIDLIINPSHWDVNGKTGIKAYLKSIYVTLEEDDLERKYADVPDSAQNSLPVASGAQLSIEASREDEDIIDAEWEEV